MPTGGVCGCQTRSAIKKDGERKKGEELVRGGGGEKNRENGKNGEKFLCLSN